MCNSLGMFCRIGELLLGHDVSDVELSGTVLTNSVPTSA
jgi:hypothetical protein